MLKVKNSTPRLASEGFDAASSFVDQLIHDKTFRRKLRAARKASAAASRRAQAQTRRQGLASLVRDPVLKRHVADALSQLQAAGKARKRPDHKTRNLFALVAGAGAMTAATLKLRHRLGEKPTDTTEDA
jgi:uncharacterized membrane protein